MMCTPGPNNCRRTDANCFAFLEHYFSRLEGPIAVQVWHRFMPLVKEVLGNLHGYKPQIYPLTRQGPALYPLFAF